MLTAWMLSPANSLSQVRARDEIQTKNGASYFTGEVKWQDFLGMAPPPVVRNGYAFPLSPHITLGCALTWGTACAA